MKNDYNKSINELTKELNSNINTGLSVNEAIKRLNEDGKNELLVIKKSPFIMKFLNQFKDFMIIVLLIAALISIAVSKEYGSALLIILIVVVNAFIGAKEEDKAEKSLDAIKDLTSPFITVLRDSKEFSIDVKEVVVGDIVILKTGDFIPADGRVIETFNLMIDESSLTGESHPITKITDSLNKENVPLSERDNFCFMGSVVTYGRGKMIITNTSMHTEMGKITEILNETTKDMTPLQKSVSRLGKTLALVALLIVSFIFVIEIIEGLYFNWDLGFIKALGKVDYLEAFLFAVSLAVAAIPEGLPAIITVVLSLGMQSLVKQKAIVKTLPAVEALGSTEVICSDKTGTLTLNIMTAEKIYLNNEILNVKGINELSSSLESLITYSILVNDSIIRIENDDVVRLGNPTELAFLDLALKFNLNIDEIKNKHERLYEIPFDSLSKLMITVHDFNNKRYALIKGAPDVLLNNASSYIYNDEVLKDKKGLDKFNIVNTNLADEALRVLAVAIKEIDPNISLTNLTKEYLTKDITLVGLVGMMDPPRPEVKDAVNTAHKAGIKTIMITGDHLNTAVAIAKKINIIKEDDEGLLAVTGSELDLMTDEEFLSKIENIKVYARVSPLNKVRIVKTFKSLGKIVAMTGDGVNDAPSVKHADIGISMGITGTEVTKSASDMVLTDDNYTTIVNAVSTGRTIFSNIKKAIHFLLSCNIGEILSMFLGVTLGVLIFSEVTTVHILLPVQILWVNLVTDSFLALALGMEPKEDNIMNQKPNDPQKSIFSNGLGLKIFYQGLLIGTLTFIAYSLGYFMANTGNKEITAQTMAFMVLALSQLAHALNVRSETTSIFKLKRSKPMALALLVSFILQMIVILIPPIRNLFNITLLGLNSWLIVMVLSLMPLLIIEIQKLISKKIKR